MGELYTAGKIFIERPYFLPFPWLLLAEPPNDLRLDVAAKKQDLGQFNAPPHQAELN
jgi:hypothetical protein